MSLRWCTLCILACLPANTVHRLCAIYAVDGVAMLIGCRACREATGEGTSKVATGFYGRNRLYYLWGFNVFDASGGAHRLPT